MENNKEHFYFAIALIAIFSVGGFVMLQMSSAMTDLVLIEGSFYGALRNGEARLSAEISRGIQDADLDILEEGFNEMDEDINNL